MLFQTNQGYREEVVGPYDSGSIMSFLSYDVAKKLSGVIDWERLKPFNIDVTDSQGESIDVRGITTLNCIISGRELTQDFVIARISEPLLLGLDFIHKYNASWDLRKGKINYLDWNGPYIQCFAVSAPAVVPPKRLSCLRISVADESSEGTTLSIDPENVCPGVSICPGVTEIDNGESIVWIENLSNQQLTISPKRYYPLGEMIDHSDVLYPTCCNVNVTKNTTIPEVLSEMIDRIEFEVDDELKEKLQRLIVKHRKVFALKGDPLGRTDIVKHVIKTENVPPIKQAPRRVPIHQEEVVESNMRDMIEDGVIQPSESPWASPVVLVKKKDGTCRFCIDYRRLNEVTIKDAYPLPRIEDNLDCLTGSKYFTTLDLKSGYWQVEMSEDSKEKTAFASKYGLYEWNVMPFGLTNAPATFQRLMEKVLFGLQWKICALYIDDVIVMSNTIEEGIERLDVVLTRLASAGLKLKPSKCDLLKKSVTFLGHVVDEHGIRTDPAKVDKIVNWPVPTDLSSVRSFLGLASYYRKFVKSFAAIANPLTELSKKNVEFVWGEQQNVAFETIKDAIAKSTALAFPTKENDKYILDTDASAFAIGGVLSQIQDGVERPLAFGSRCLNDAERNYCVTRRELLAVVYYITKEFKHYLLNAKVKVRTDHGCLTFLKKLKNPCGQMARWIERLAPYEWTIEYRPGARHGNADAMSRRLCDPYCKQCNKALTKREGQSLRCLFTGKGAKQRIVYQKRHKALYLKNKRLANGMSRVSAFNIVCPCLFNTNERQNENQEDVPRENTNWDRKTLVQDVKNDPDLSILLTWTERPSWEIVSPLSDEIKFYWSIYRNWKVDKDGLLWYRWLDKPSHTYTYKLIIPKKRQKEILSHCHDSPAAGHFGEKRSIFTLQRLPVFWHGFKEEMKLYCRTCDDCLRCKPRNKKGRQPMDSFQVGEPLQRMGVDIAGPFHESARGNKYIMVVMDYFTKWAELIAIPDHTAETCAKALVLRVFAKLGVPCSLHSDQGRDFMSTLFQETCRLFQIERTRTTPWRPQSNGMVERLNRTVAQMLRQYVDYDQTDWDLWLPLVGMAYNGSVHSSKKYSPFFLMYGRKMRMPLELVLPTPEQDIGPKDNEDSIDHFVRRLQESLQHVHKLVRVNLGRATELQRRQYNKRSWVRPFYPGQGVWLLNPRRKVGRTPKLDSPFEPGAYTVVRVIGNVICEIQKNPRSKPKIVHCDKLEPKRKPHNGEWVFDLPERTQRGSEDENLAGMSAIFEDGSNEESLNAQVELPSQETEGEEDQNDQNVEEEPETQTDTFESQENSENVTSEQEDEEIVVCEHDETSEDSVQQDYFGPITRS